jgi:hypothetical protein
MEYVYEDLVCWKLTRDPLVFANRHYNIGNGHSCPDIVALHLGFKEVWIVEVSTGSSADSLAKKILNRDIQWFDKLRETLLTPPSPIDSTWNFVVKAFIRKEAERTFRKVLGAPLPQNVHINILDNIGHAWNDDWWNRSSKLKTTCKNGHNHSEQSVMVAAHNPTEPYGIRPFHCEECKHISHHNKIAENWISTTLQQALSEERQPCQDCFPTG